MPSRPTLLLILSLPLGAVVYTIASAVMTEIFPREAILSLLVPLFVAGLAMMPLLIPFFDRKATQDLAEYRRQQAATGASASDTPTDPDGPGNLDDPGYDGPDETGGHER